MGALLLSFEERLHRRRPLDRLDLAVPHNDPLDDDSAELLAACRRGNGNRLRQLKNPGAIGVEGPDPVAIRQVGERGPSRIPFGLILRVIDVTPGVLLLELLQASEKPSPLAA